MKFKKWILPILKMILISSLLSSEFSVELIQAQGNRADEDCVNGVIWYVEGNIEAARPLLESGFGGREESVFLNLRDLGLCAMLLGELRSDEGDLSGALEALLVADTVFKTTELEPNEIRFEARTLNDIGVVYLRQREHDTALTYFEASLDVYQEIELLSGQETVLNNIGMIHLNQGKYDEALTYFEAALEIYQETGSVSGLETVLNNIGLVYRYQQRYEEALIQFEETLKLIRSSNGIDPAIESGTLNNIGEVHEVLRDF